MVRWSDVAEYLQERGESLNPQSMAAHGWRPGGSHRLDVVIASVDHGMLHRWYPDPNNGGGWHPGWERRGGAYASRAALANSRNDTLMAFALNLHGDLIITGDFGGDLNAVNVGDWPHASLGRPENDRLVSHPTPPPTATMYESTCEASRRRSGPSRSTIMGTSQRSGMRPRQKASGQHTPLGVCARGRLI